MEYDVSSRWVIGDWDVPFLVLISVGWLGGEVPRLVAVEGDVDADGR